MGLILSSLFIPTLLIIDKIAQVAHFPHDKEHVPLGSRFTNGSNGVIWRGLRPRFSILRHWVVDHLVFTSDALTVGPASGGKIGHSREILPCMGVAGMGVAGIPALLGVGTGDSPHKQQHVGGPMLDEKHKGFVDMDYPGLSYGECSINCYWRSGSCLGTLFGNFHQDLMYNLMILNKMHNCQTPMWYRDFRGLEGGGR